MRENPPVSIPPSRPAPVGAQGKPTLKDPQEIEDFLLYRLFRITHVGLRGTDDMYKRELGISRREWRLLAYLARTPDASLKALAADAGIDVVSSEYATVAAENTALERLSDIVADQIVARLAQQATASPQPK